MAKNAEFRMCRLFVFSRATRLLLAGVDLKIVQQRLGPAGHYDHVGPLFPRDEHDAAHGGNPARRCIPECYNAYSLARIERLLCELQRQRKALSPQPVP
jgi:hypothetical protein